MESSAIGLSSPIPRREIVTSLLRRRHGLFAAFLFLAGAVFIQRHAVVHLASVVSGNGIGDPTQFMWSMWWWPHALLHGENPFVTRDIWVGNTYNLASVTTVPLPALVASPITALFGPIVSYNLLNLVAPVLSAWFAYRLCLYMTGSPAGAILGGWLYGFCSYGLGQLEGHLQLVFTFCLPLLVQLYLQRFDGALGRTRFVLLSALAVAIQTLCGTEILFTSTCMGAVALIAAGAFCPGEDRRKLLRVTAELIAGYVLAAVVCSPYLYYALTGPEVSPGQGVAYPADLLSLFIPTPITALGGSAFTAVSNGYIAGFCETGTYLGIPLIAIVIAHASGAWKRPRTRVVTVCILIAILWSLGQALNVDGHSTIKLPWNLIASWRGFNEILPTRIGLYTELGAAIAAAIWVSVPTRVRWRRWLLAALAVVFVFPNSNAVQNGTEMIFRESYTTLPFFGNGEYKRYLHRDEVVLPIPFGYLGESLLWQAQAHGYFRLASGWFGYWPPNYYNDPLVMQLIGVKPSTSPDPVTGMRSFLERHDVGAVVVQDGQGGPWPAVLHELGLSARAAGGVDVYAVPRALSRRP